MENCLARMMESVVLLQRSPDTESKAEHVPRRRSRLCAVKKKKSSRPSSYIKIYDTIIARTQPTITTQQLSLQSLQARTCANTHVLLREHTQYNYTTAPLVQEPIQFYSIMTHYFISLYPWCSYFFRFITLRSRHLSSFFVSIYRPHTCTYRARHSVPFTSAHSTTT